MLPPALPPNETDRLESLRRMHLLYTPDEGALDSVTRTTKLIFNTPIVLISLLDHNRQWFKSCIGLPVRETSRDISFCGHAILADEIFVIEDATQDERFADNPLVIDEPKIRFYAGRPLKNREGFNVGTLCLIDHAPRTLSATERRALDDLGKWAELAMVARELSIAHAAFLDAFNDEERHELLDAKLNLWRTAPSIQFLEREAMRSYHQQTPMTVLKLEVANFAAILAQYGPQAADALLAEFAQALSSAIRAYDTIGRQGETQFMIILPNADEAKAAEIIARIKKACSLIFFMPDNALIDISIRLGKATADFLTRTPEAAVLLEEAEQDMTEML